MIKKSLAVSAFLLTQTLYVHTPTALADYAPQDNTLAVLELTPKGNISTAEASIITDRLRTLLVTTNTYHMIERSSIQQILKEQGFQSSQICDETNCSVEIGRILSVKKVIVGSVSKLGTLLSVNARLIDVEKGLIEKEFYSDCFCNLENMMLKELPPLVGKVSAYLNGYTAEASQPSMPQVAIQQPSATTFNTPTQIHGTSVRGQKPQLIYLDGAYAFNYYGVLAGSSQFGYLHNFSPYFAWGLYGGITSRTNATITGMAGAHLRAYTNPNNLAGFVDLGAAYAGAYPNALAYLRPGIEYRDHNGFTVGAFVDLQLAYEDNLGAGLFTGYAF